MKLFVRRRGPGDRQAVSQQPGAAMRLTRRRRARKSSSMMMFVTAAALLVTGGVFGAPWLTGFFSGSGAAAAANEAGVVCPRNLVGLMLVNSGEGVRSEDGLLTLECRYALDSSGSVVATVSVTWTDAGSSSVLLSGCGLPPASYLGVFTVEGSYYGVTGLSRADYSGQQRYVNAMQDLASDLARNAASISAPCPDVSPVPTADAPGTVVIGPDGTPIVNLAPSGDPAEQATATANAATGTPDNSGASGTSVPGTPGSQDGQPDDDSCLVAGRVTDSDGVAVRGIMMTLLDNRGAALDRVATNNSGVFEFNERLSGAGKAVLEPTDFGRDAGTFRIFYRQAAARLTQPVNSQSAPGGECRVNFDLWDTGAQFTAVDSDIEKWPAIIELYQNFNSAAGLADMVQAPLDYGLPMPVYAWCDSAELFCDPAGTAEFAFYAGSTPGREFEQPYIALGVPTSEMGYKGVPDNREFHEFGHAFMADVLGDNVPAQAGNVNHGGYFRNASTTDSWVEGFAEFYSIMVAKHVESIPNPERYLIGAEYDLEEDRLPWEAIGWWEEFTIAGLLLDFEDGDSDYAQPPAGLDVESVATVSSSGGNFAIGRVRNSGERVTHSPEVTVDLLDGDGNVVFTQVTAVKPQTLGPGQTGVFYVAAPEGVQFENVSAAPGRPAGRDDDPIDVELEDLLRVVTSDWGEGEAVVETVTDLYGALSTAFAGSDLDGDGTADITQADIDAVFLEHGFFDDMNGSRQYEASVDGGIGGTSHPSAVVSRTSFPELMPRFSADGFEGSFVDVDTAGVDAELLVQVEMGGDGSRSYAYWTSEGSMAPVELAVPSSGKAAAVTVIAAAEGRNPAVAYRTSADAFHSAVDSGEITSGSLRSSVALEQGNPLALIGLSGGGGGPGGDDDGSSAPPWMMVLPVVLAGVMLAGGVYMMRRNGRPVSGGDK